MKLNHTPGRVIMCVHCTFFKSLCANFLLEKQEYTDIYHVTNTATNK